MTDIEKLIKLDLDLSTLEITLTSSRSPFESDRAIASIKSKSGTSYNAAGRTEAQALVGLIRYLADPINEK